jgi:hypothetical protein
VDPKALASKIDHVLAMRGDPKTGVGATAWAEALAEADRDLVHQAVIDVVRELLVPEWAARRKNDRRPQDALDAASEWLASRSADAAAKAKAAAKACTAARNETFGDDHRVPEAARGAAWAVTSKETKELFEALASAEAELLARVALMAEYHRGPEMRRSIAAIVKRVVLPVESAAAPTSAGPDSLASAAPVPYSADEHFSLGQRLVHKKFGEVTVTSVGETWIEVSVADGTKKRLAHKP